MDAQDKTNNYDYVVHLASWLLEEVWMQIIKEWRLFGNEKFGLVTVTHGNKNVYLLIIYIM